MIIKTEEELLEIMTKPGALLVDSVRSIASPLVILGAGGKMGPSLAILARRACDRAHHPIEIVAVSRFTDAKAREKLETNNVRTVSADLMDRATYASLPDTENLIYLVGLKFGTSNDPAATWATNTLIPAYTLERYAHARIAALSTGNVYPLVPVEGKGSKEDDPLTPLGEYANACVARERIFEYFSVRWETPVTLLRLSYALDLRYGVLVDIAVKVLREEPIDVTMSHFNCIWQGDANTMIIRSLSLAKYPPEVINLVGSEHFSIRETALKFGERMGRHVQFSGKESQTALLSDNQKLRSSLGEPDTPIDRVIDWTATWVMSNGRLLNKPTHFEIRDGVY
jgi:hypothetical protein